jgi:hypothetical protein
MSPARDRSMQMGHEPSLLDDARFLEELAKVEALPREDTSVFPKPVPTVAEPAQPTAIADELPPALGPRTKGPQFVLAPPPSRRKSSHRRSTGRAVLRIGTTVSDPQPTDDTDSLSTIGRDASAASCDDQGVRQADRNTERHASLNAFPTESARPTVSEAIDRTRVRESKQSASLHPALAVVGLVLMMSIGAGAAALVFHDRVTQIVALLGQSAARR